MPRPKKCRKVCCLPKIDAFYPAGGAKVWITLTVDEYEAIRLIDKECLSQEDCAKFMQVSRATVQNVYDSARHKLAQALVDGVAIRIAGGNYTLCDGTKKQCCQKHCCSKKGEQKMKIAVTYENGQIFQHFGHTEQFKIYEIADGKIISSEIVAANGCGHGALAGFLAAHHVAALICGGIGGGAQMALRQANIQLFGGVQGDADQAVENFICGNLAYDPDAKCDHHAHEEGHSCGSHGCGQHSCHS